MILETKEEVSKLMLLLKTKLEELNKKDTKHSIYPKLKVNFNKFNILYQTKYVPILGELPDEYDREIKDTILDDISSINKILKMIDIIMSLKNQNNS